MGAWCREMESLSMQDLGIHTWNSFSLYQHDPLWKSWYNEKRTGPLVLCQTWRQYSQNLPIAGVTSSRPEGTIRLSSWGVSRYKV